MKFATAFPERAERLSGITDKLDPSHDFPLLKACSLKKNSANKLKDSVLNYLHATLTQYYSDLKIQPSANILEEQVERLAGLPNVTPNGIVLPKLGTLEAYNFVHTEVVRIFEESGLHKHVEAIFAPVSIRLVKGTSSPKIDNRPRSTTKYHLDIWSGEPADAISVLLPVLGDTKNVGIKWVEPADIPSCLRRTLDNFNEGQGLVNNGNKYNFCFQRGDLLLFDPYLLHATQKKQNANRVSIDFRFIATKKAPGDSDVPGIRRGEYIKYATWQSIGRTLVLDSMAPLEAYNSKDLAPFDRYPGAYQIIDKNDRLDIVRNGQSRSVTS